MSQTTKRALEASFKKLLLEKPLNKITINDITEDCGVNRMTFYYHFKDIYDLVDWILAEDAAKAMEGRRGFGTWSEAYLDVLRQLQDNKTLVLNVYRSVGREQVEQYLYRLLDPILKDFADRECHDITVQDADKQFVVDFYKYALVGMTLEWTRRDMRGDPKKMVERVSTMIHGDFRRALCRLRNLTADICSAKRRAVATRGFCSPYRLPRRMRPPSGATRRSPAAVWRDTCAGCSRSGGTGSGYISRPSGCCSPSHAPPVPERRLTKRRRTR